MIKASRARLIKEIKDPTSLRLPEDVLEHRDRSPWVGVEVVVTNKKNPCRGRKALVLNVLPNHETASGLKVEVRFAAFDPSVTNARRTFDYDDLVEFKYVFWTMSPSRS